MVDSSWDNGGGGPVQQPGGFPLWMKVVLALGMIVAVLVVAAVGTVQRRAREFGPLAAQVLMDLSTEEGSRNFLRQHPETLKADDTEEAFLQRLRAWREVFGGTAAGISRSRDGFRAMPRPFGWRAYLKGRGETWLGILAVGKELHVFPAVGSFERARIPAQMDKAWKRALAEQALEAGRLLQDEEGARRLYRENPALAERFPSEAAFLAQAARLRPLATGLPSNSGELAMAGVATRVWNTPFGSKVELTLSLEGGRRLQVFWKQDRLRDLELE